MGILFLKNTHLNFVALVRWAWCVCAWAVILGVTSSKSGIPPVIFKKRVKIYSQINIKLTEPLDVIPNNG